MHLYDIQSLLLDFAVLLDKENYDYQPKGIYILLFAYIFSVIKAICFNIVLSEGYIGVEVDLLTWPHHILSSSY